MQEEMILINVYDHLSCVWNKNFILGIASFLIMIKDIICFLKEWITKTEAFIYIIVVFWPWYLERLTENLFLISDN